jgi:hypothetical protein
MATYVLRQLLYLATGITVSSKNKPKLVGKVTTTTTLTGYTQYTEDQIMLFLCVKESGRNGARRRQE